MTTIGVFDHQRLFEVVQVMTRNLNKVIDVNYYPVKEAATSNLKHRPIGIGTLHLPPGPFCFLCWWLSFAG